MGIAEEISTRNVIERNEILEYRTIDRAKNEPTNFGHIENVNDRQKEREREANKETKAKRINPHCTLSRTHFVRECALMSARASHTITHQKHRA